MDAMSRSHLIPTPIKHHTGYGWGEKYADKQRPQARPEQAAPGYEIKFALLLAVVVVQRQPEASLGESHRCHGVWSGVWSYLLSYFPSNIASHRAQRDPLIHKVLMV